VRAVGLSLLRAAGKGLPALPKSFYKKYSQAFGAVGAEDEDLLDVAGAAGAGDD